MTKLEFVEATLKDMPFMEEMLLAAVFVVPGEKKPKREIIQKPELNRYVSKFGDSTYDIGVIVKRGNIEVGAAWGRCWKPPITGYGFIDEYTPELTIAVKDAYRNKGIGAELIRRIEDEYRKIGVKQVSLSVDRRNPAIRLYQRLDFVTLTSENNSITMYKEL